MPTISLNHILRRWLVSLSGVLLGLIAAMVFVLSLSDTPSSAQAADFPRPLAKEQRANADWRAAVKDQLGSEGGISANGLTPSPVLTLTGEISSGLGSSVATAGDVNGDGYSDVIVGAPGYNYFTGRAYLYLGSASGLNPTPAFTATGEAPTDQFGLVVATAGDVNGDGYADVMIAVPFYSADAGRVYLYFGSANGLMPTPAYTATGESSSHIFGDTISTAGDVNGDGYSDVVIGTNGGGRFYLYTGSPTGLNAALVVTGRGGSRFSVGTAGDVNGDGYADVVVGESFAQVNVYYGSIAGLNATPAFTATGENFTDGFGNSVATAGDVNGDGYSDVVVGAGNYMSGTGRAYVYLGSPSGLNAAPTVTVTGEAMSNNLGHSVATAGDVNGDGYADMIIGAPRYLTATGRAYVFLGSSLGLSTTPAFTATGESVSNAFGLSAATAGDVNGDGYADIIVGANRSNNITGRAYVYHGAADAPGSTAVFTATGEASLSFYGVSVGTAGDVNGDGYSDVGVGASGYGNSTGRAYVYQGSPSGLRATPVFTATGEASGSSFGTSVATAGDVNGDGYADIIIGAPGYNSLAGRAYIYLGSAAGLSVTPIFTSTGEAVGDRFGWSVAPAGDVNGDGYSDVIIGAYCHDNCAGRGYLYLGSAIGLSPTPVFTVTGEAGGDYVGVSVGTAGDVNGDGYADVLIGSPGYYGGTGRVYLYLGSATGVNIAPAFTATGEAANNQFGITAQTAGDVNSDGYADIIVGAKGYNNYDWTGRVYLYLGSSSGLTPTPAFTATGEAPDNFFGSSVNTAGDVNGDGFADVIVGAYGYPGGFVCSCKGRGYVYLGNANGLSTTPAVTLTGESANDNFGLSVSTAGDVDGDGYADVIVGAFGQNSLTGKADIYVGNGSYGLSLAPQQRRADNSAPIAHGGRSNSESAFRLAALGRSPFGRGKVKLEREVKPLGVPLDGTGTQQSATWMDSGTAGTAFDELVTGLSANTVYHWRVRVRYHPATTPFQQYSRWFTQPWNGWQEADFRTAATGVARVKLYLPLIVR